MKKYEKEELFLDIFERQFGIDLIRLHNSGLFHIEYANLIIKAKRHLRKRWKIKRKNIIPYSRGYRQFHNE